MAGVPGAGRLVTRGQVARREGWPAATEEGQSWANMSGKDSHDVRAKLLSANS